MVVNNCQLPGSFQIPIGLQRSLEHFVR